MTAPSDREQMFFHLGLFLASVVVAVVNLAVGSRPIWATVAVLLLFNLGRALVLALRITRQEQRLNGGPE